MLDPADLFRLEADVRPSSWLPRIGFSGQATPRPAEEPAATTMIVALEGFLDAGQTQRILVDHLLSDDATVVASFDVDQLLDYRGRRPVMVFEETRYAAYQDPSLVLHRLRDRDGQPYLLLHGPEPDYQWERFIEAVRQLADRLGVTLVVQAHGIPMAVPHTRPVGMTTHTTNERLVGDLKPVFGKVQVPASVAALLELRFGEAGRDAVGFSVHVPHYLAQAEFHDAALTALNAIVDVSGLNLPNDDLVTAAGENRAAITAEMGENPEVAEAVGALERQYDRFVEGAGKNLLGTETSPLPSADELGAEFEDFLRTVADEGEQEGPTDGGPLPR